jgi:hypothetical protein
VGESERLEKWPRGWEFWKIFISGRSVEGFSKGGDGTGRSGSNWCDASLLMDVTHRLHSGHSGSMSVKGCPQRQEQCCCLHEKLGRKEREKGAEIWLEENRATMQGLGLCKSPLAKPTLWL